MAPTLTSPEARRSQQPGAGRLEDRTADVLRGCFGQGGRLEVEADKSPQKSPDSPPAGGLWGRGNSRLGGEGRAGPFAPLHHFSPPW